MLPLRCGDCRTPSRVTVYSMYQPGTRFRGTPDATGLVCHGFGKENRLPFLTSMILARQADVFS